MERTEIAARVQQIKQQLAKKALLVAAIKMQSVEDINTAILAGVDAIAENKVQEFRLKNHLLLNCPRHFIGHLQTNKVKYLIGKIDLYHSCDRDDLAQEIARLSIKNGLTSNVLLQVNIGDEESKGGYAFDDAKAAFERVSNLQGICVKGFMAMLPNSDDEKLLRTLAQKMYRLFEWAKTQSSDVKYLSMGMSGDYALCVEEGSNMVRLGSTIFGARNYQ